MVQGLGFVPGWTCSGTEAVEWRGRECPEVAENVGEISDSPGSGFGLRSCLSRSPRSKRLEMKSGLYTYIFSTKINIFSVHYISFMCQYE